jgi:hypothetical protein
MRDDFFLDAFLHQKWESWSEGESKIENFGGK